VTNGRPLQNRKTNPTDSRSGEVRGLRALQQEIGKRNRFKPITDKEIRDALDLVADSSICINWVKGEESTKAPAFYMTSREM
jgi:hypothetical protein